MQSSAQELQDLGQVSQKNIGTASGVRRAHFEDCISVVLGNSHLEEIWPVRCQTLKHIAYNFAILSMGPKPLTPGRAHATPYVQAAHLGPSWVLLPPRRPCT